MACGLLSQRINRFIVSSLFVTCSEDIYLLFDYRDIVKYLQKIFDPNPRKWAFDDWGNFEVYGH